MNLIQHILSLWKVDFIDRKGKTELFYPLVNSMNGWNRDLSQFEAKLQELLPGLPCQCRSTAFPANKQMVEWPTWDAGASKQRISLLCHCIGPADPTF